MPPLQEWIHKWDVGEEGTRWVKVGTAVLAFLALMVTYNLWEFKSFSTEEAMDNAQLARNLAQGEGFTTQYVRPFSLHLMQQHQGGGYQLKDRPHPDLANAPVYPMFLAGLMQVLPFDYRIPREGAFERYQPEFLIAWVNQGLFLIAVFLVFRLARRLFDSSVAWLAAVVFAGANLFWRFSVSGLSTMLLIVILLGVAWGLVVLEQGARQGERGSGWCLGWAVGIGLLVGLGGLTRYSFAWLILPVAGFLALYFPGRRLPLSAAALIACLAFMAPWLMRNHQLSGAWFGTPGYSVYQGTGPFEGDRLTRSQNPDFTQVELKDVARKLVVNTADILRNHLPKMGGSWISAFFLTALMIPFNNPAIGRLRLFIVSALIVLVAAQALGQSYLAERSPEVNSENLLVLMAPLIFIYGAAVFFLLLDQIEFPIWQGRHLATIGFGLLACAPLILALLPPRSFPQAYPPYWPPVIQQTAQWMEPGQLVMSDMPWAVAWYGDRQSISLSLHLEDPSDTPPANREDFYAIHDFHKTIQALYLTSFTLDADFVSELMSGQQRQWGRFVMECLVKREVPDGFPLPYAPSDFFPLKPVPQMFFTDWQRWKTSSR